MKKEHFHTFYLSSIHAAAVIADESAICKGVIMKNDLLQIGELADFFNISAKALRIYEKKEIIKPSVVDPQTGYRYYSADQVKQLNALIELKQLGFSLSEIKQLMDGGMSNEVFIEALKKKKTAWQDTISAAQNKIESIEAITARLTSSDSAKKLHELSDDERAWLLVKMVCVENLQAQSILSEAIWL